MLDPGYACFSRKISLVNILRVSEAERHLVVNSILNNGYISGAEILLAAEKEENVKKSYVSF